MSAVKLMKKYIGTKVVLADGTRTTVASLTATAFKLATGKSIKPTALTLNGTTLKEASASGVSRKAAPVARGAAAKKPAAKAAPAAKKASGTIDVDSYDRKKCISECLRLEVFEKRTEARGKTIHELRDFVKVGLKGKKGGKAAPAAAAPAKKTTAKAAPAKTSTKKPAASTTKARPTLAEVKARTGLKKKAPATSTKPAADAAERRRGAPAKFVLKPLAAFNSKNVTRINTFLSGPALAEAIKEITGYDVVVACVNSLNSEDRCTVQIGLLPTNASEEDISDYAEQIAENAQLALEEEEEEDDLGDLDDDLGTDDDDTGEEDLDDLENLEEEEEGEEDDTDTEDEEASEEDDEEEEEFDVEAAMTVVKNITGKPAKVLLPLVEGWAESEEVYEALGDDVGIGTQLVSNKSQHTVVVIGFSEEREGKVALWDLTDEKFTFASIVAVAKMEYAEPEDDEEEEEEVEEDEDDLEEFDEEESEDLL